MKNTIIILVLSSFFTFSACKKRDDKSKDSLKTETTKTKKLTIDSVKTNDILKVNKSLSVSFSSKLLVFPDISDKKLLDSIYFTKKRITDFSKSGLQNFLKKEKEEFFKGSKDWNTNQESAEWYSNSDMNLKYNRNDFIQIKYSESSYYGGAHGSEDFFYRVFDLKQNKKLELNDITTMPRKELESLLMKNVDKISNTELEQKNSDMLLVKVIPVEDNFYFDDENLYFCYNSYAIASYAAGIIVIPISWKELKGTLNPEFKERMKIK